MSMATQKKQIEFWYDLHAHFLPGIDDGCQTCAESLAVLRQSGEQGIRGMMATPHYYPKETVAQFLKRRDRSYNDLLLAMNQEEAYPLICLGAEVAYHPGLVYEERLEELCLGQSRYLLLEMPFEPWSKGILRDVEALRRVRGVMPIIAHLERYLTMQEKNRIEQLTMQDVLIQMNAAYLLNFRTRRNGRKRIAMDLVQVLGSDCHNLTSRPPNLGQVFAQYENSKLEEEIKAIECTNRTIFQEAFNGDASKFCCK